MANSSGRALEDVDRDTTHISDLPLCESQDSPDATRALALAARATSGDDTLLPEK